MLYMNTPLLHLCYPRPCKRAIEAMCCSLFVWSRTLLVLWFIESLSQAGEKFSMPRMRSSYCRQPSHHNTVATIDRLALSLSHCSHSKLLNELTLPFLKGRNGDLCFAFFSMLWLPLGQTCYRWAAILSTCKSKRLVTRNYWVEIGRCPTAIITSDSVI